MGPLSFLEAKNGSMVLEVSDFNQRPLSVSKVVKAGKRVVFEDEYSCIGSEKAGEVTWLKQKGGMYTLKM